MAKSCLWYKQDSATLVEPTCSLWTYVPPTPWIVSQNIWGQLLSIWAKIYPCHTFTTTTLLRTYQRKTIFFCALCFCQMIFQLGEVKGGISFRHLSGIDFLRASWTVIHYLPSLPGRPRNEWPQATTIAHAWSKKSWSNFPKEHGVLNLSTTSWQFVHSNM